MMSRNQFTAIFLLVFSGLAFAGSNAQKGLIFSADFASYSDIELAGLNRFRGDPSAAPVPPGFDFLYTSDSNPANPACEIRKGVLVVYDESRGTANSWGADCQLMKYFDRQYPEMWIKVWFKGNPAANVESLNLHKFLRMGHYNPDVANGVTGTSIFNTNKVTSSGLTTGGLWFMDIRGFGGFKFLLRGNPDYKLKSRKEQKWDGIKFKNARGKMADQSWLAIMGDGRWHTLEVGMKLNSGNNAYDGELYLYLDGVLQGSKTDVNWLTGRPTHEIKGFNAFSLGGNADNVWSGQSNDEQEFYYFRRVEAATSRIQ